MVFARSVARMRFSAGWRAVVGVAGLLLGCRESGREHVELAVRYANPGIREQASVQPGWLLTNDARTFESQTSEFARIPAATIGDDTRSVIASFPVAWSGVLEGATETDGSLRFDWNLGAFASGMSRVFVVAHLRPVSETSWTQAPPVVLSLAEGRTQWRYPAKEPASPNQRRTHDEDPVSRMLAGLPPGSRVSFFAWIYPAANEHETRIDLPPTRISAGARLETAIGVLDAARNEGPVRFSVERCEAERCEEVVRTQIDPAEHAGWRDLRVDLSRFEGHELSFRLRTRALAEHSMSLPVWAAPELVVPRRTTRSRPPNFILISIDTLARGHLDAWGYEFATAPFLRERLAARGTLFEDLMAEATTTDPSHMTMFTSLPTSVHGVHCCLTKLAVPVDPLASLLGRQGYATVALTEDGPLARDRGFGIGFDRYVENKSPDLMNPEGHVEHTFAQAREALTGIGDRPFFLFLHTFQVHAPHTPPPEYHGLFTGERRNLGAAESRAYDQEIRYVDDVLAALHAWLDRKGLLDDTYVFLLSDHGEQFFEHGMLGHGTPPFEEVLRVPLIVTGPGVPQGVRDATPLHHLDLMPTLLDLAGVPIPPQAQGRSFAANLRGAAPAAPERERVSASWSLPAGITPPVYAVRSGRWKLIRTPRAGGTFDSLFDLETDPGEQHDQVATEAARAQELSRTLERYTNQCQALAASLRASATETAPALLDPEREGKLRALGYIE